MAEGGRLSADLQRSTIDLCDLIDEHCPSLTSLPRPDLMGRQLSAGGLARCRMLLEGIVVLIVGGRPDVKGVLLRPLFETWMVSLYLLLGGSEAVTHVIGDFAQGSRVLSERHGRPLGDVWQLWLVVDTNARRLKYEEIARKVDNLLDRSGDPLGSRGQVVERYDALYRVESRHNVHAGLGSIGRYVDWQGSPWSVRPAREEEDAADDAVILGGCMAAHLAVHVFREFGLSTEMAKVLYRRLDGTLPTPS